MNDWLCKGTSALASMWIQACCGWGWACVGYGVCVNGVELVMQFVAKGVCHVLLLKGPSMTAFQMADLAKFAGGIREQKSRNLARYPDRHGKAKRLCDKNV